MENFPYCRSVSNNLLFCRVNQEISHIAVVYMICCSFKAMNEVVLNGKG